MTIWLLAATSWAQSTTVLHPCDASYHERYPYQTNEPDLVVQLEQGGMWILPGPFSTEVYEPPEQTP